MTNITTDDAIDWVYNTFDELITKGHLKAIDIILKNMPVDKLPVDILLSVLTVTLPIKGILPIRKEIFNNLVEKTGVFSKDLLYGLE